MHTERKKTKPPAPKVGAPCRGGRIGRAPLLCGKIWRRPLIGGFAPWKSTKPSLRRGHARNRLHTVKRTSAAAQPTTTQTRDRGFRQSAQKLAHTNQGARGCKSWSPVIAPGTKTSPAQQRSCHYHTRAKWTTKTWAPIGIYLRIFNLL